MAENKFRGMDINGNWYYGNLTILKVNNRSIKKGSYISNSAGMPFAYLVRPETVGQFTGIIARKTKQEVYFGDKIKLEGDDDYSQYDGWIVSDKEPLYVLLESPDGKDYIPLFSFEYRATISEVIGNIYEK